MLRNRQHRDSLLRIAKGEVFFKSAYKTLTQILLTSPKISLITGGEILWQLA